MVNEDDKAAVSTGYVPVGIVGGLEAFDVKKPGRWKDYPERQR